jgi:hypothetical protein
MEAKELQLHPPRRERCDGQLALRLVLRNDGIYQRHPEDEISSVWEASLHGIVKL